MATVVDVDSSLPEVKQIPRTQVYVSTAKKPDPPKQITSGDGKYNVARSVLQDLVEIYEESAEYIESKAHHDHAVPDRMVLGILHAASTSANPIAYLAARIQTMNFALGEIRSAMSEIINEEQRQIRQKREGK